MVAPMNNKRKSMRHAADPCLGFYLPNSPIPPPGLVPDLPPIEVICDDSCSLDGDVLEPPLTVDAFLRRSALTRTYSKKSRQRANRSERPVHENLVNPAGQSTEMIPTSHPRHPSRRADPKNREYKPLKKRLLSAAVLSHVDPGNWLLHEGPTPQTRIPLPFLEEREPPSRPRTVQAKRRGWTLVDPRKNFHLRSNPFSKTLIPSTAKRKNLSGWQATYGRILDRASIHNRKDYKASKTKLPLQCLPLTFISLQEAERSYSLMR
ncbi:hypothetical protein C8R44DRAFT_851381, partial [Mycena epipterygia]